MNFEKILFKSTIRNLKLYLYYLISSCAAVFIFIITSAIINHPVLIENVKGDLRFNISYIKFEVILISIFFIMYSLNTFINMRKREFGVLMALGVDYKDFYKFFMIENLIVGGSAIIIGVVLGVVFLKFFLIIFSAITKIESMNFYFPTYAIIETVLAYTIIFILAYTINCNKILKKGCNELLIDNKKTEALNKWKIYTSIIILILMILLHKFNSHIEISPIYIFIEFFTIAIINFILLKYLIPYILHLLSKIYFIKIKGKNIILLSSIKERFINMSNIVILATILLTVTFAIISMLYTDAMVVAKNLEAEIPYTYCIFINNKSETIPFEKDLDNILEKNDFSYYKIKYKILNLNEHISFISNEDYNKLALQYGKSEISVNDDEVYSVPLFKEEITEDYVPINGKKLSINKKAIPNITYAISANDLYVISENMFNELNGKLNYLSCIAYDLPKWTEATKIIDNIREEYYKYDKEDTFYMISRVSRYYDSISTNKISIYFSTLICTLIYFMALSLVYIRFYNEVIYNKINFRNLKSIGATDKEIEEIISREMAFIFFVPYILAFLNAFMFMKFASMMYSISILNQIVIIFTGIFIINIVYFLFWRFKSIEELKNKV